MKLNNLISFSSIHHFLASKHLFFFLNLISIDVLYLNFVNIVLDDSLCHFHIFELQHFMIISIVSLNFNFRRFHSSTFHLIWHILHFFAEDVYQLIEDVYQVLEVFSVNLHWLWLSWLYCSNNLKPFYYVNFQTYYDCCLFLLSFSSNFIFIEKIIDKEFYVDHLTIVIFSLNLHFHFLGC